MHFYPTRQFNIVVWSLPISSIGINMSVGMMKNSIVIKMIIITTKFITYSRIVRP